ncbi:MAG: hypothetical protein ACXW3Z_04790 [Limisphaerales bacterium]
MILVDTSVIVGGLRNPVGVEDFVGLDPRVALGAQPWASFIDGSLTCGGRFGDGL